MARRFGLGAAPRLSAGPVARGRQGEVWRLTTSDGAWAVKTSFRPRREAEVLPATHFQEAAHTAGVPTPAVVRTTEGQVLAEVGGVPVRVFEWVDLLPPDPLVDPDLVGAVLGALHQVRDDGPSVPPDPWSHAPVGADRWDDLLQRLRAGGAPFAGRLAALRDELVALESWIEPPRTLRTCHRDLWADNLLPTTDGLCVIDWEEAGPADPSNELAAVLFEFARTDPGRVRALLAAYEDAGGPGRVERPGHFTMLIAQLGHITEVAAEDWLAPNVRSPDRADSAAWVGEVLDEPHTRRVLRSLLRAAAGPNVPPGS
ncbi:phosphotransferase [Georgenia sp. M64]|uniref:phosphotransferase n=1 Tax=Georgenia sp. M64 TaxID=3120520 RepID=UPI0030DFF1ED